MSYCATYRFSIKICGMKSCYKRNIVAIRFSLTVITRVYGNKGNLRGLDITFPFNSLTV